MGAGRLDGEDCWKERWRHAVAEWGRGASACGHGDRMVALRDLWNDDEQSVGGRGDQLGRDSVEGHGDALPLEAGATYRDPVARGGIGRLDRCDCRQNRLDRTSSARAPGLTCRKDETCQEEKDRNSRDLSTHGRLLAGSNRKPRPSMPGQRRVKRKSCCA